ncbi:MAG: hypothetical protein K0Q91_2039 [Fibrobacteria bacterium]|jgi:uncharacterized protein (TIGR02147 family)|nr:hypothetical protein [Fibrobacteria bacterium]
MLRAKPTSLSVFQFLDARDFLREAYRLAKRENPAFSQRYIAQVLKASSSSFFRDVLSGKSKLTPARVLGFARLFKLAKAETAYFENLVAYTQADTPEEKSHALEKLKAAVPSGNHALLEASQKEYFSKWHYAAVRELVRVYDFRGDCDELGALLNPPITEAEARDAIDLLLRLKLIRKAAHGRYEAAERVVLSGPQVSPAQVRPALEGHLDLARRALEVFPPAKRPFHYVTVSVSENSANEIRGMIREFKQSVLNLVTRDPEVDRLYQMNFQFFPVSETIKRRKK